MSHWKIPAIFMVIESERPAFWDAVNSERWMIPWVPTERVSTGRSMMFAANPSDRRTILRRLEIVDFPFQREHASGLVGRDDFVTGVEHPQVVSCVGESHHFAEVAQAQAVPPKHVVE